MFFLLLASILLLAALYCALAVALRLPAFKVSGRIGKLNKATQSEKTVNGMLTMLIGVVSPHITMSGIAKTKTLRLLRAAEINMTPEQFAAKKAVIGVLAALPLFLLEFIHPLFVALPVGAFLLAGAVLNSELKERATGRAQSIEKELPQFIANVTAAIDTNRDILDIFTQYKLNYSTDLTRELSVTVADMRTGSQEKALERLAVRVNLPLMTELVRCLLATLQGENMAARFNAIREKAKTKRTEALHAFVLKRVPKISGVAMTLAMFQMVSILILVFVAMATTLTK